MIHYNINFCNNKFTNCTIFIFNHIPAPKKYTKLSNKNKSLIYWVIEKRNEVAIPLLVLEFLTTIKKFDSPVANPAFHSLVNVTIS